MIWAGNKLYVAESGLQNSNPSPKLWEITLPQTTTGLDNSKRNSLPGTFSLGQNYPNPFNPTTVIGYQLPVMSKVSLKVYDILGREVVALMNEIKPAGNYSVRWSAQGMPSGIYFYRLVANAIPSGKAGSFVETRKLVLLK